ncbi:MULTISPECIES: hypothetical protein [unclassified Cryobacterium]|uniref:hypothetical protein n=1 Tax=unclassified Cryobacterium TaxID=2649013 RepID=UPI00106BBB18|nr:MULTISPECIES: hypothetical protein [unclassified Cryobacterium]TFB96568.1 hypothetical protein E3O39_10885 [Cryobacterium sp. MDB2-A-1]TFC12852.1 hypothetical protein E3O35_08045 [Cryobacterium sp. MDB2-A-2]
MDEKLAVAEVVITRYKQYKMPNRSAMYAWKWIYYYTAEDQPEVSYGTGLVEMRRWLKGKYPSTSIRCAWQATL